MSLDVRRDRAAQTTAFAVVVLLILAAFAAVESDKTELLSWLALVLAVAVVLADLSDIGAGGSQYASGSFVALMVAAAFLGPTAVLAIVVLSELVGWLTERYRWQAVLLNVVAGAGPFMVVAAILPRVDSPDQAGFYVALAGLAALALIVNFTMVAVLFALLDGEPIMERMRLMRSFVLPTVINVVLAVAATEVYVNVGFGALIFTVMSVFAFTYMARLVVSANERTRQYASLSWGVLSGLLRTLDIRDPRAARHAAGVAAFSRDIAQTAGLNVQDCELAHTAGLLHDIGRFGLSDRVMERGRTLTEDDWQGIRQHPILGADLLRDLGAYGPVAEIVRAHHERIDGRGYPDGLRGDDIPVVARIVAVAEVYDTLTAEDTYRTPVSSFEALNELRRVSGSQLDGRYVEALAELLAGRGVDYRHADYADFDSELDLERRINEAAVLPTAEGQEEVAVR